MSLLGSVLGVATGGVSDLVGGVMGLASGGKGGGGSAAQQYSQALASQSASDQAQTAAVQSQLTAAQANAKNWEYAAIGAAFLFVVAVVVFLVKRKKK